MLCIALCYVGKIGFRVMARKRKNADRSERGGFVRLPHAITRSHIYTKLSAYGLKLLVDLGDQYNGKNNGDLSLTFSVMKNKGWRSPSTLSKAIKELKALDLIEVTRQGSRKRCSLYALTIHAIDECNGKHYAKPTERPKSQWRRHEPVQDIKKARARKQQMDDKQLTKAIMERAKREMQNA